MFTGENLLAKQITLAEPHQWEGGGTRLCVLLLQKGKGRYRAGDVSRDFAAGDVCVISESTAGTLSPLQDSGLTGLRFLLYCEQLGPFLGVDEICLVEKVSARLTGLRHLPADSEAARRCHTLWSVQPGPHCVGSRNQLLNIALAALADAFEEIRPPLNEAAPSRADFVELVNRLSAEDVQKLPVGDLATKLGYSRRHLNRLFQEHLGTTISDLRMEMRLIKAIFLLQNPTAKVIDVALESGFNHLGLFSQCFKRRFHLSPNQWRERERSLKGKRSLAELVGECGLADTGLCIWAHLAKTARGIEPGPGDLKDLAKITPPKRKFPRIRRNDPGDLI